MYIFNMLFLMIFFSILNAQDIDIFHYLISLIFSSNEFISFSGWRIDKSRDILSAKIQVFLTG